MSHLHDPYAVAVDTALDLPIAEGTDVYMDTWIDGDGDRDGERDVAQATWHWDAPQSWMHDGRYPHGLVLAWSSEDGWSAGPLEARPSGAAQRLDDLPVPHYAAPEAVAAALTDIAAGREPARSEAVWPGADELKAALIADGAAA